MTEVFYQPRRSGKTTKMIEMSNKLNQTIIVNNRTTANLIAAQAEDMNLIIPPPRSVMDYLNVNNVLKSQPVLIDEAQHVLRTLLKTEVTAMTINNAHEENEAIEHSELDELKEVNKRLTVEVALLKKLLAIKDKQIDAYDKPGNPRFRDGGIVSEKINEDDLLKLKEMTE